VFLLQAIDALRPKQFRPRFGEWPGDRADYPRGVRYYEDVVLRDTESHWRAWRDITVQQLNAELAVQLHTAVPQEQCPQAGAASPLQQPARDDDRLLGDPAAVRNLHLHLDTPCRVPADTLRGGARHGATSRPINAMLASIFWWRERAAAVFQIEA
jgi:hypothetical protein